MPFIIDGKRVAVVGSRDYGKRWEGKDERGRDLYVEDWSEVIDFVGSLPPDVTIVSGGARGVDTVAVETAIKYGMAYKVWPADWIKYGKVAGYIRNRSIVDDSDIVVAFWNLYSHGTKDTIDYAKSRGVRTIVFTP